MYTEETLLGVHFKSGTYKYEFTKGTIAGRISLQCSDGTSYLDHCSIEEANKYIKAGSWQIIHTPGYEVF